MEIEARIELAALVSWAHAKGWAPGTGGNFSRLLSTDPFALLITPSGLDKGSIGADDLIIVDASGQKIKGKGNPSAETLIHVTIVEETGATAIAHTHSIWNTLASLHGDVYTMSGFEMLKGLAGVLTHQHVENIPVLDNSQDMVAFSQTLRPRLKDTHAVLLRGHGLYTWGHNMFEARRHLEVLEFLFELNQRARRMD
ncbi:MAG: methylthioribulose 1-phosphate dehydratase [Fimbriimonadaceae bacterium]